MRTRISVTIRHLAIAIGLLAIAAWLWTLGPADVRVPPTSLDGVTTWIDRHDAVTVAFALVRLEALGLAAYLLALTAISAVVRTMQLPMGTRLVDRLTLPFLRGVFGGLATLGVVAGPAPVHRPAQTPSSTTTTTVVAPVEDPSPTVTLHLDVPLPDPEPAPAPAPTPAASALPLPAPEPAVSRDTWVVQPGDSLWSIAASHLEDVTGAPSSDAEVTQMWDRLIDLNRERLVDPDNPDLIFADQVFELPAMELG